MEVNCDKNVDYDQAQRMAEYFMAKTLGKLRDHNNYSMRVWVKNTNPDWSAGVENFKCRIETRYYGKVYYSEYNDENLGDAIKNSMKSLTTRIRKDNKNQKKIRNFKRHELISA